MAEHYFKRSQELTAHLKNLQLLSVEKGMKIA